jgi:hypothetical protein
MESAEDYIDGKKELDGFDLFPFDAKRFDQALIVNEAAKYIWKLSEELTNEYKTQKSKEFIKEIFGFRVA